MLTKIERSALPEIEVRSSLLRRIDTSPDALHEPNQKHNAFPCSTNCRQIILFQYKKNDSSNPPIASKSDRLTIMHAIDNGNIACVFLSNLITRNSRE